MLTIEGTRDTERRRLPPSRGVVRRSWRSCGRARRRADHAGRHREGREGRQGRVGRCSGRQDAAHAPGDERALARGDAVYGLSRGVGALKTVAVSDDDQAHFNRIMLVSHSVRSGPIAAPSVARAAMVTRAAGLALGYAGVRPQLAEALCAFLNAGVTPALHTTGSVGQADLSQMAEIGLALTGQTIDPLEPRQAGLEPLELGPRGAGDP